MLSQLRKYSAFFWMAVLHEHRHRMVIFSKILFFFLILFIFDSLWKVLFASGFRDSVSTNDLIWYIAVTEWILLSAPALHLDIQEDIHQGQIAYHLGRPVPYAGMRLAEGLGTAYVRMFYIGIVGLGYVTFLSGDLVTRGPALLAAFLIGPIAAVGISASFAAVGLAAFWIEDSKPIYWVYQKFLFILGGLMIPLNLYPDWVSSWAVWTPFAAFLYSPARSMIELSWVSFVMSLSVAVFWSAISVYLLFRLYRSCVQDVVVQGG